MHMYIVSLWPSGPKLAGPKVGEQWEKAGNWTQGDKRGRVAGVLSAPLPLLAQEDPYNEVIVFTMAIMTVLLYTCPREPTSTRVKCKQYNNISHPRSSILVRISV
eukprot:1175811-Prorocentrum_minimum.AAC.1